MALKPLITAEDWSIYYSDKMHVIGEYVCCERYVNNAGFRYEQHVVELLKHPVSLAVGVFGYYANTDDILKNKVGL